ncbi:MAG: cytochrome c3 family protein [Nitrospirota bacterium]
MKGKQRYRLLVGLVLLILLLTPVFLYSEGPHADRSKLPRGCASCHRGHGRFSTPMLPERKEVFCFRCHGHSINVEKAKRGGDLAANINTVNIQKEFEKPYRHPIEKIRIHRYDETLPERDPSMPRHAECVDCHHHHYVKTENKIVAVRGANRHGAKVESVSFEYELCFKCHSYSANLPADQTNKAEIFDISNPSYHPVEAPGRNNDVPSLIYPLTASSLIKCTDCHNNDDPAGPKGPHGSIYRYILTKNFTETDGSEGDFQYELCYSCHRRESILSNESFQLHYLHISTVGTSCRTCHNPHGSTRYTHLVDFDNLSIRPSNSGRLEFSDFGNRAGQCFLNCHGKDHDPAVYPAAVSTPSTSSPSFRQKLPIPPPRPLRRF